MSEHPLSSLSAYSRFVSNLLDSPLVERSTISVWPTSVDTGIAEGEVFFQQLYFASRGAE